MVHGQTSEDYDSTTTQHARDEPGEIPRCVTVYTLLPSICRECCSLSAGIFRDREEGGDAASPWSVRIVEESGGIATIVAEGPPGTIEAITGLIREANRLVLQGLHVEGPGAGSVGLAGLRQIARQLGRQEGMQQVVIYGGTRTTGARPGKIPKPIVIRVD